MDNQSSGIKTANNDNIIESKWFYWIKQILANQSKWMNSHRKKFPFLKTLAVFICKVSPPRLNSFLEDFYVYPIMLMQTCFKQLSIDVQMTNNIVNTIKDLNCLFKSKYFNFFGVQENAFWHVSEPIKRSANCSNFFSNKNLNEK